jgi:uncharacterized SAM-binding protein YcdF (DUF218 family)
MSLSRKTNQQNREGVSLWLSRRGLLRRVARTLILLCVLSLGALVAGFIWFADSVATMTPPPKPKADAIIALTGGYSRIEQAVELLDKGAGKRLLISGVNPKTTSGTLRRVTQSSAALFTCCVDIGYQALDTIGNANEAATWIHSNDYRTVLVVTNNYHMRRSLHELRIASPQTDFVAYPVVNADLTATNWFMNPDVLRTMTAEYLKFIAARARDITGLGKGDGLRKD